MTLVDAAAKMNANIEEVLNTGYRLYEPLVAL